MKWVVVPGLLVAAAFWLLDGPEPQSPKEQVAGQQAASNQAGAPRPSGRKGEAAPAAPASRRAARPWPAFIPDWAGGAVEAARVRADANGLGQTTSWSSRDLQGFITLVSRDDRCSRYRVTTNSGQTLVNLGFAEVCGR